MEEFFIKAAQLILSLSIIVVLHELGHFIPAKLFKTRVEKFYLFFNPWFSLFKVKKGETEYGIGWLPLGGYVKISGMIDESMDKDQMKKDPEPWEYRSKPAWQRLVIILGGVIVNFILAFAIYALTLFYYGERYLPNSELTQGVWVTDSIAYDFGLRTGDKIISINGNTPNRFTDILEEMPYGGQMTIERDGRQQAITIPADIVEKMIDGDRMIMIRPRMPFVIGGVPDSSHNAASGLQVGDRVLSIDGEVYPFYDQYTEVLEAKSNRDVTLEVEREGESFETKVHVSEEGKIGVMVAMLGYTDFERYGVYNLEKKEFGLAESFPAGISKGLDKLSGYWRQLSLIFDFSTGAYKGVGSFGTMGKLFSATWNWQIFWEMTALLSVILGLMNVLPIPALDGGHATFIVWELISGRQPNQKVLEVAQTIGMVLLLLLMTYAIGNDIFRAL